MNLKKELLGGCCREALTDKLNCYWVSRTAFIVCFGFILQGCTSVENNSAIESDNLWSEITQDDLHFIRAILRENHPGPRDSLNPWFEDWYKHGFNEALALANRANNYPGYYFSIQHYMQGFQDGHLGALGEDILEDPRLTFQWPGFVVQYKSGYFEVAESEELNVLVGARLVACDGLPAEDLSHGIIQKYFGLWSVEGARPGLGPKLFIDAGNPFVRPLTMCTWDFEGGQIEVELSWKSIQIDSLRAKLNRVTNQYSPPFGLRPFANNSGYWISLPSFAMGSEEVRVGLDRILADVKRDANEIRNSDVIVIDVRGNSGGSSTMGDEVIKHLWGEQTFRNARPRNVQVDWRVSAGNNRFLRRVNLQRFEQRYGEDDPGVQAYREFVKNMDASLSHNEIYYREASDESGYEPTENNITVPNEVKARVFFLTDHSCFSACLDFADILRRIPGVVHIGLETRADAVYIDNRAERLPSGLGLIGFSMKVYRNRIRGHNESYVPDHLWEGDISDDDALERWVMELARD